MPKRTTPGFIGRKILILTCLAHGPLHGYALIQEIERVSGLRVGPGTLYGLLNELSNDGLIEELPTEDRRSPFRLTGAGRALLQTELDRAEQLIAIGRSNLTLGGRA